MPRKKKQGAPVLFDVWLRRKMAEFGFDVKDVAGSVDVSEGAVSRWLNEGRKPERRQVARLALLFKVSPATILKITDPDAFLNAVQTAKRQHTEEDVSEDISDVLAQVPELRSFLGKLARMTPERRAALMLLAQSPEEESQ